MGQAQEELYHYFGSYSPTGGETSHLAIEAFEIWRNSRTGQTNIETGNNPATGRLDEWLAKDLTRCGSIDESIVCVARIVLADKDDRPRQPRKQLQAISDIIDHFGLQLAHNYAQSCVLGTATFPRKSLSHGDDSHMSTYMLVHPKLEAIWSVCLSDTPNGRQATARTQVVILAGESERSRLKSMLSRTWDPALTSHPMFPAFLCGLIITQEVDKTHDEIRVSMRSIEARTGHHMSRAPAEPAQGGWGHLSARTSGFARKLASTSRKIQVAKEFQDFISTHVKQPSGITGTNDEGENLIKQHVEHIRSRLNMQWLQNEFLTQKVNIQLTAIFNLMARNDSSVGLKAASSSKTLALLALVFLPGNFVAALFSAPLFDWEGADIAAAKANSSSSNPGIGVGLKPQFQLFWAITIPFTVLAFFLYLGWSLFEKRRFETTTADEECG
ncbi:hypothetical protein B0H66DRAFT_559914 [Apodospora peruviana]|uniref:Uncharacterized protein n=1 Tax=Apodospora peruviana TaxID=516989 RepID=A0AAE0M1Q0_9PEZI|nr:hypothetical protein B0H66DRAFT_559914 [Apodospora peruviana]